MWHYLRYGDKVSCICSEKRVARRYWYFNNACRHLITVWVLRESIAIGFL